MDFARHLKRNMLRIAIVNVRSDHGSHAVVRSVVVSGVGGGVNLRADGYCESETYEHSTTCGNNII